MYKGFLQFSKRIASYCNNLPSSLRRSKKLDEFLRADNLHRNSIDNNSQINSHDREILIVFYNRMFGGPLDLDRYQIPGVHFSEDTSLAPVADVVVIHAPEHALLHKPPGQLWVSWSLESDIIYPGINDQAYDLKMTYQQNADIWIPYCRNYGPNLHEKIIQASPVKEQSCLIASFISSKYNQSKRLEYLSELSKHIDVHHYGRFMKNRTIENDVGGKSKMEVLGRYKFAIAFENSITPDYVTEKYYDPLLVGTIPLYLGAPNISDYAPGHDCHINVNDFNSPADLASYLIKLDQDGALLDRHLKWKKEPLRTQFATQIETNAKLPHSFIQLAELVRQRLKNIDGFVPDKLKGWKLKSSKGLARLTNRKSGHCITLDGTSWLIWELSNGKRTINEIQNTLAASYPNMEKQIRQDVIRTLRTLWQHGVVELI